MKVEFVAFIENKLGGDYIVLNRELEIPFVPVSGMDFEFGKEQDSVTITRVTYEAWRDVFLCSCNIPHAGQRNSVEQLNHLRECGWVDQDRAANDDEAESWDDESWLASSQIAYIFRELHDLKKKLDAK